MPRWRALAIALFVLVPLAVAPAAGAHDPDDEDHPGWYIPSPESRSRNMHLLGSAPRTRPDSTYRNSDLAFWGRLAYAGHYDGFRIIDISDPEAPAVVSDVTCPGQQHDVSVWENLLFLSIDAPRSGPECTSTPRSPGWEGIRIFDVSNPTAPSFVRGVATDCGSHTHTLVPDLANARVLLYVSSYPASGLGQSPVSENSCERVRSDGSQGHSKISIVEVPLADPGAAQVVAEPTFELRDFRNPGLRGCHDITVFMELDLAAAACLSESQMWDISDLEHPVTTARIHNEHVDIWHSAAFTWDGAVVTFGDEAGGGTSPRCRESDPSTVGAAWFYAVSALDNMDGSSQEPPLGHFKIPRPQGNANCTMHNFNVIQVRDRYILVSSNYAGGTSVADFTDPANAREIAHLDPHGANTWSSYWYNGFIYTNDSGRGVDVISLSDRARAGARKFAYMNPQTQ